MNIKRSIFIFSIFFSLPIFSQVYSDKVVGKKNAEVIDSLKVTDYPYSLPIWGQKATEKGFSLPYSAGVSVNTFWTEAELNISNLYVGFNGGTQYNLDEVIRFNSSYAEANSINIRPDVWVFPFLNVYGILAKVQSSTSINAGVWLPVNENDWTQVATIKSKVDFDLTTYGVGITPTIGVGGGWLALDMNMTWSFADELEDPAFAFVFDPRVGKTFKFDKPDNNVNIWVGAMRVKLDTQTKGSLPLGDIFSTEEAQAKIDNGYVKLAEGQTNVDNWWNSLSSIEQKNPVNVAKYETANKALDTGEQLLNGLDGAIDTLETSTVQYSLEKEQANMWNFLVGGQYQHNKHWMFRAEVGFLGTRTQVMAGMQYRFGL